MRFIWLLTTLLWAAVGYAQTTPIRQAQYYQEAYRAILTSPEFKKFRGNERCVAVFDSIVAENQSRFLSQLGKHWNYQGDKETSRLRDSLDTADTKAWHKPYYSALTADLTTASAVKKGCVVILFSRQHNDMLLAEVSVNLEGGPALHNILSMFNQTVCYLLFFGSDGKVQLYHTQLVGYN
jgi:hypothetical protein